MSIQLPSAQLAGTVQGVPGGSGPAPGRLQALRCGHDIEGMIPFRRRNDGIHVDSENNRTGSSPVWALPALFLLSGACGLVYQVLWSRMLIVVFGATLPAVSTVLGAFMAGLALGSFCFGRWIDGVRRPHGVG